MFYVCRLFAVHLCTILTLIFINCLFLIICVNDFSLNSHLWIHPMNFILKFSNLFFWWELRGHTLGLHSITKSKFKKFFLSLISLNRPNLRVHYSSLLTTTAHLLENGLEKVVTYLPISYPPTYLGYLTYILT